MRNLILAILALAGMAGLAAWSWQAAYLDRPLSLPSEPYLLEVPPGTPLSALAEQLADDGVLDHPLVFVWSARLRNQASRIQAGEYELAMDTTPRGLLERLVAGRVKLHGFTIVEGWSVRDLLAALRRHAALVSTLEAGDARELAVELEMQEGSAEGLFLPDTYLFARGTTDRELLRRAEQAMRTALDEAWSARSEELPLAGPYEALIVASIVEKETALAAERPRVAGVIIRRLQRGMKLQMDPTVIYGLGERYNGNLTRRHLATDGAYNTYTRPGLPPTPIALPGAGALAAAVAPAPGDALYFVATGLPDGSHEFSATLEQHNRAVQRYLERLSGER